MGIIHGGNLLFQGTLAGLQRERAAGARRTLSTSNNMEASAILRHHHSEVVLRDDLFSLPMPERDEVAALVRELVGSGIDIYELSLAQNDLEAIFMDMITK
ncbi:ABC-2 type transport system ATP-binding protein [Mucilaginibacter pineti]|uniref:ABC-2 type transport system ATP-binding protein n=1 Tax=Mucilaginibacter pineti TaxID=1391627 RepID=A0A1G7NNT7_9SPHI|nr:hypothetical protein [Mucilaginibacter pineti]SDF75652.1 ABC-2 type transport system ATP-binding protein [Mucilaginibacter pineti]